MNIPDYEQLTLFREDSPASRLVLPGSEEARKMTVSCGRSLSELYTNSSRLGSLVRMCLESSIWHSTRCFLTWKRKVTKSNVSLYQLAVSMPRTKENGSQLWPTMTAGVHGKKKYSQGGKPLTMAYAEKFGEAAMTPEFVEWLMGYEQKFTELVPTPRGSCANGSTMGRHWMPSSKTVQVEREREGRQVPKPARGTGGTHAPWENWPAEPSVGRVADGVPNRVDRLRCLGNAVVPQQFYPFFAAIAEIERNQ